MKNYIFLLFIIASTTSFGQQLRDREKVGTGVIKSDGRVEDNSARRIGQFLSDGTIEGRNTILGYIRYGKVMDMNHSTLGYVRSDGTVEDKGHNKIGYIQSDGTVVEGDNTIIGYASGVDRQWAAVYYFFIHFK